MVTLRNLLHVGSERKNVNATLEEGEFVIYGRDVFFCGLSVVFQQIMTAIEGIQMVGLGLEV